MATVSVQLPTTVTPQLFKQLCEAASRAPSPDNNQPWAFRACEGRVDVFHCRDRALPSDVRDMFSWTALGAAIENIVLSASTTGLASQVEYNGRPFARNDGLEHVATIQFSEGSPVDPLADWIDARTTNRKLYSSTPIESEVLARLSDSVTDPDSKITWLSQRADLKQLAKLIGVADRIRFEYRPFHEEFHEVLRYDDEQARRSGDGLDLKTLETPAIAGTMFRWLRPWKRMALANRFGLSRLFADYSAKQVKRSGAIGLLTTSELSDQGYLEAGRSLQRIWLASTKAGLAFQPLGGLPLFLTKLGEAGTDTFLPKHAHRLQRAVEPFHRLFPASRDAALVLLFRIGSANSPSARSYRYSIEKIALPAH